MKVTHFIEKQFQDLTTDEIKEMRRGREQIPLDKFVEHYGITLEQYGARLVELDMWVSREERLACKIPYRTVYQPTGKPNPFIKKELNISRVELSAVRMFRGMTIKDMAKKTNLPERMLYNSEKGTTRCPDYVKKKYLEILEIKESELERIRAALSGKVDRIEIERPIPDFIRKEVCAKYGNKCASCSKTSAFHIHHKMKFSKGGLHELDNLILLCVDCHAETHKNDREYSLLKSIAERIRAGVIT